MSVMVAAPTAASKDYALDNWLSCYENFITGEQISLFLVDTTAGTLDYAAKLGSRVGHSNVAHLEPEAIFNLVHIVSSSWNLILREARRRKVDWIFSVEIDVYCPTRTLSHMLRMAERNNACLVTHGYPYPSRDLPLHSVGCMLINPKIFAPRQQFYDGKNPQFEDEVWRCAFAYGGVIRLDNILEIEHDDSY